CITAESAKLRLVFRRRPFEHVAVLCRRKLVRGAFVGGGEFRRAFDRFSIGKIGDRIVALQRKTVLVDVNDFGGWRQSCEGDEPCEIWEECFHITGCSWVELLLWKSSCGRERGRFANEVVQFAGNCGEL